MKALINLTLISSLLLFISIPKIFSQWQPVGSINIWTGSDPHIQNSDPDLYLDETGTSDSQFGIILREDVTQRAWLQFDPASGDLKLHCEEDDIIFESSDAFGFDVDGVQKMVLTGAGRLGIGVGGPAELLHIDGGSAARIRLTATGSKYLTFYEGATEKAFVGHNGTDLRIENNEVNGDIEIDAEETLKLNTNDIQRMIISKSGNIGIGTSSPAALFHLNSASNTAFRMEGTNGTYLRFYDSNIQSGFLGIGNLGGEDLTLSNLLNTGNIEISSLNKINFLTNTNERFTIDESGKIGIGTTNPSEILHIDAGAGGGMRIEADITQFVYFYDNSLQMGRVGHYNNEVRLVNQTATGSTALRGNGDILFGPIGNDFMKITSGGKVGIGTNSVGSTLHVNGGIGEGIRVTREGTDVISEFKSSTSTASIGTLSNHDFRIISNNSVRMTISEDGNVGINQITPTSKLHITGDARMNGIRLWTTVDSSSGMVRYHQSDFQGRTPDGWKSLTLGAWTSAPDSITHISGKVGIGTDLPAYDLEVDGDVNITGELTSASDQRIKESINPLQDALSIISQLNPVKYNFKTEEFPDLQLSDNPQMGLLAQELEEILPSLVSKGMEIDFGDESDALKSVNYVQLIPLLIQGIKELNNELKTKESELEKYEDRFSALEDRIRTIEQGGSALAQKNTMEEQNK